MSRQSALSIPRGSIYAPAPSSNQQHAQSSAPAAATGAAGRLAAKQAELAALLELKELSARLARDIDAVGDSVDQLGVGGDATAAIMSSWQGVFRAIQLARGESNFTVTPSTCVFLRLISCTAAMVASGEQAAGAQGTGEDESTGNAAIDTNTEARNVPETLVRIPVEGGASAS